MISYKPRVFVALVLILSVSYIYGPPLHGLPTFFNVGVLSGMGIIFLSSIYFYRNSKLELNVKAVYSYVTLVSLFIFLMVYHLLITKGEIIDFTSVLIRNIVFISISFIFAIVLYDIGCRFKTLIKSISYFLLLNSILMLAMVFDPSLQHSIDGFVNHSGNITDYERVMRFRGVLNMEGDSLGVMYSLYFLFVLYLYPSLTKIERWIFFSGSAVVFLSILFSGRTGLITLGLIIFVSSYKYNKKLISHLSMLISFLLAIPLILYIIGMFDPWFDDFLDWLIFDFIEAFGRLGQHLFLPQDPIVLLFGGEGYIAHSHPTQDGTGTSDSGYIRQIFAVGIILTTVTWAAIYHTTKYLSKDEAYFVIAFIFVISVAHIKTLMLFSPSFIKLLSMILFFGILDQRYCSS